MAKLLDLLVAAEGFVPVAGRVYAQDGDGRVHAFRPEHALAYGRAMGMWVTGGGCLYSATATLADDHTTAIISAEAILEARACQ